MKRDGMTLFMTLLLVTLCQGHVINTSVQSSPMLGKMDEITRHLQELTRSMAELDRELEDAVVMNGMKENVVKRSMSTLSSDDDDVNCRLHLREDICQVWEMINEHSGFLHSPSSQGKRSGEDPLPNFSKLAADLKKKREMLHTLRDIFKNAASILEREKKWMTCNLNLGFTCQTQEYSNIADYYDFLNSADSPGKKRSAPQQPTKS